MPAGTEPNQENVDAGSSGGGENPEGSDPAQGEPGGFGGMGMGGSDVKLQYINDNPSSYSSIFGNAKTDVTEADQTRLIAALKALNSGDASVVDTESVLRYFVVHNYTVNGDSYTGSIVHNYYLYEENGILDMIPWDYNLAYGTFQGNDANATINDSIDRPLSVGSDRPMFTWITSDEETKQAYYDLYQEFLDTVDPVQIIEDAMELIAPYVKKDPTKFCTLSEFTNGVEMLKRFCTLRSQSVAAQIAGENTTIDASTLSITALGTMGGDAMGGGDSSGGGEPDTGAEDGQDSSGGGETADPNAPAATEPPQQNPNAGNSETGETVPGGEGSSGGGETGATMPEGADPSVDGETNATAAADGNSSGGGEVATLPVEDGTLTEPNGQTPPAGDTRPEGGNREPQNGNGGWPGEGSGFSGAGTTSTNQEELILLGISLAVLLAGLLVAGLFKRY